MGNPKKRVGFIARGLSRGGVTRMIVNLLREIDQKIEKDSFFVFTDDKNFGKELKNIKVILINSKNKLFWDYVKSFFVLKKFKLDVVVYPKHIIPLTHLVLRFKKIIFINDVAYYQKDLNAYKLWNSLYMKMFTRTSCLASDLIISISESTKKELVKYLDINPEKIKVVYLAVESRFQKKDKAENFKEELPFLFYSGSVSPRKNLLRIVTAFDQIKGKIKHNLYITGRDFWNCDDLLKLINNNDELKKRVKFLGFLEDEVLVDYYNKADLYLFASLYEGFGLPILEAQACDCPVLTSNVTSCPEVAGEGAHIVDPYSVDQIRDGILKILFDEEYKKTLIRKGRENLKRFSWEKSAQKLLSEV